jgi:hypothetical protein
MMMIRAKDVSDVLYALAMAMPVPNAKTLEDFVRRYPQHADALTEFAIDLALEGGEKDAAAESEDFADGEVSPAVARAISHFQQVAYDLEKAGVTGAAEAVRNPIAELSKEEFRAFAVLLGANTTFVMKLRDREIEPDTIVARLGFCRISAEALHVAIEELVAHVRAPQTRSGRALFKSDSQPGAVKRETFEQAVESSGLTPDQQRHLLSL